MPRGLKKLALPPSPGGTREDVAPEQIPDGAWLSSSNFVVRNGVGEPRLGYAFVSTATGADTITAIATRGQQPLTGEIILHSLSAASLWDNGASTVADITGTWTTSAKGEQVRMTTFPSGGTTYLCRVNFQNKLTIWSGSGNFVSATDLTYVGRDVFVLGNRVVIVGVNDFDIQFSGFNDINAWAAADKITLSQTRDKLIAGQSLNPLTGGVYKEDSVWALTVTGTDPPFQAQLISRSPGPVSPASVVVVFGTHYWLGSDKGIYSFDGSRVDQVSRGLENTLKEFAFDRRDEVHGHVFDLAEKEIWWYYPTAGNADLKDAISLNLVTGAITHHSFETGISASMPFISRTLTIDGLDTVASTIDDLDLVYATIDSMTGTSNPIVFVGDVNGKFYEWGDTVTDDTTAIAWNFEYGWKALGGIENRFYLDGILSYWKKSDVSVPITVTLTTTDSLGDSDTAITGTFDLNQDSNHLVTFLKIRGKWAKVKFSATKVLKGLEHRGSGILGWARAMV